MLKARAYPAEGGYVVRETFGHRMAKFAMVVFVLNIIAILVLIIGWVAGWFHVDAGRSDVPGQYQFRVAVNTQEVSHDVEKAIDKTKQATESVQTAAEMRTLDGQVASYDAATRQLTVDDGKGAQVTFHISDATEVELDGGQSSLSQIQRDEGVRIVYREKDNEKHAVKIQRLPRD